MDVHMRHLLTRHRTIVHDDREILHLKDPRETALNIGHPVHQCTPALFR